jgi:sugar-specific transcriptional regulator TrmB
MLNDLGLDRDEASLYKQLVSIGSGTVGKLSAMTSYSRTKVYSIVDKLASKGWITSIFDKPKTYAAVDPKEVVKRKKETMNASSEGIIAELSPLYERTETDLSEIVTYRGTKVIKKVTEMLDGARKEVNIVTAFLPADSLKMVAPTFRKLKNRGVKINILVSDRLKGLEIIETMKNEANIDFASIPDAGLLIVDGEEILLGSKEGKDKEETNDLLGIWTRSKELVTFLQIVIRGIYTPLGS